MPNPKATMRAVLPICLILISLLPGCAVVGAAASVAGTVVGTAADVATTAVSTTADIVTSPIRNDR